MRGDFSVFRQLLLDWFWENHRLLPWRTEPSLYRTVISEFMLQQTQIETVLPYFENWLKTFPDFQALANASEKDVLKQWEGLGYYSRARNLLKLARSIRDMGIPKTFDGWLQRPGIGPYTAAAISSIAQGQPQPVIDGNVIRVLCRINADDKPVRSADEARRRLLPMAEELIDHRHPGDFNEAMMELGATICRKTRPSCLLCPVHTHCEASAAGIQADLPVIVRKQARQRSVHRLWMHRDGKLLVQVNAENANRLAGIAELPLLSQKPAKGKLLLQRKRGISSEIITESIYRLDPADKLAATCVRHPSSRMVDLQDLDELAISAPHRRWIATLLEIDASR